MSSSLPDACEPKATTRLSSRYDTFDSSAPTTLVTRSAGRLGLRVTNQNGETPGQRVVEGRKGRSELFVREVEEKAR
jgi:hypothetical protein